MRGGERHKRMKHFPLCTPGNNIKYWREQVHSHIMVNEWAALMVFQAGAMKEKHKEVARGSCVRTQSTKKWERCVLEAKVYLC